MLPKIDPSTTESWKKLSRHFEQAQHNHLRDWFEQDPDRFESLSRKFNGILFDFSKNRVGKDTMELLGELFNECKIKECIENQFNGAQINSTEGRSVLHTALRDFSNTSILVDGKNVIPDIKSVLGQMKAFSQDVIDGQWKGHTGKAISDIVNIGIGGSDLGPLMVYEALKAFRIPHIKNHYVSNIDGAHIAEALKELNPETTLFIIASKTFTTQETMTNAQSAKDWFLKSNANEKDIAAHFVAVSTNTEKVVEFGINPKNMFVFWDWVGGRYSLWSSIGLSLCCGLGFSSYEKLLKGAHEMDIHFRSAPFQENIPMLMAAISIWYINFFDVETEAILPYNQNLSRFSAYFQQGNMESNGKSVDRNGKKVSYKTGPIIWGEPGTNGQHAFYQLIHQGTLLVPSDFIAFINSQYDIGDHQEKLLSNFFAQTEAMMKGKTETEAKSELKVLGLDENEIAKLLPYKIFKGNIPTTSILAPELNEETLGSLISCYEHKIFTQGIIWNIFSFDQWGVELGKQLAGKILPELDGKTIVQKHDSSTNGLINYYKELKREQ